MKTTRMYILVSIAILYLLWTTQCYYVIFNDVVYTSKATVGMLLFFIVELVGIIALSSLVDDITKYFEGE